MTNAPSIYLRAAELRARSRSTAERWRRAAKALHEEADTSVVLRAQARRILDETSRIDELMRLSEVRIYRGFTFFGQLVDATICEDPELLAELNAAGCECDKCHGGDRISAVINFSDLSSVVAVCAACFQELTNLSLGQVT